MKFKLRRLVKIRWIPSVIILQNGIFGAKIKRPEFLISSVHRGLRKSTDRLSKIKHIKKFKNYSSEWISSFYMLTQFKKLNHNSLHRQSKLLEFSGSIRNHSKRFFQSHSWGIYISQHISKIITWPAYLGEGNREKKRNNSLEDLQTFNSSTF